MAKEKMKKKDETAKPDSPVKKAKIKVNSNKKESIKGLKEQLASEKDRILRLSAEFENYKKRKQRESDEFKKICQ